jgi:capsular exopolysaccharide synthesis family protein
MYRNVMTSLISATGDVSSLAVTSAKPTKGKAATAANLAVSLAEAGFQVLLIDADLRESVLHEYFGLSNDRGLTTLLGVEKPNLADYIQPVGPRLAVVTAGPRHPNPASLIGSPRLRVIPTRIAGDADLVIVNAPELPTHADALMIGSLVQATLLVVSEGSRLRDIRAAVDALQGVPINMAGCVLHRTVRGSHPRPRAAAGSRPDQPKPIPVMSSGGPTTPGAAPTTQASPGPYALGGPKSTR